jgi:hypothetical protein
MSCPPNGRRNTKPKVDRKPVKKSLKRVQGKTKIKFRKGMDDVQFLEYLRALRDVMEQDE